MCLNSLKVHINPPYKKIISDYKYQQLNDMQCYRACHSNLKISGPCNVICSYNER